MIVLSAATSAEKAANATVVPQNCLFPLQNYEGWSTTPKAFCHQTQGSIFSLEFRLYQIEIPVSSPNCVSRAITLLRICVRSQEAESKSKQIRILGFGYMSKYERLMTKQCSITGSSSGYYSGTERLFAIRNFALVTQAVSLFSILKEGDNSGSFFGLKTALPDSYPNHWLFPSQDCQKYCALLLSWKNPPLQHCPSSLIENASGLARSGPHLGETQGCCCCLSDCHQPPISEGKRQHLWANCKARKKKPAQSAVSFSGSCLGDSGLKTASTDSSPNPRVYPSLDWNGAAGKNAPLFTRQTPVTWVGWW